MWLCDSWSSQFPWCILVLSKGKQKSWILKLFVNDCKALLTRGEILADTMEAQREHNKAQLFAQGYATVIVSGGCRWLLFTPLAPGFGKMSPGEFLEHFWNVLNANCIWAVGAEASVTPETQSKPPTAPDTWQAQHWHSDISVFSLWLNTIRQGWSQKDF